MAEKKEIKEKVTETKEKKETAAKAKETKKAKSNSKGIDDIVGSIE